MPADADTDLSYGGGTGMLSESNGRVKASPLAKRIAEEKGINLAQVQGTGPEGRIVKSDVESFVPGNARHPAAPATPGTQPAAPAPRQHRCSSPRTAPAASGDYEDIPLSQMRKTIARRLSESLFTAPHFYLTMEINMDKAMELRGTVNAVSPVKVSFNDFVIKAAALALKQHPNVNSSWLGDKIRKYKYVNVGVAVAVDEGLLVPVIRNADQKTLSTISGEVKDLAGKAKERNFSRKIGKAVRSQSRTSVCLVSTNLRRSLTRRIPAFWPLGAIKQTVKFEERRLPVAKPTNVMKVTLSCDHRVVDGATGASFLQTVKQLLEDPMRMLV